MIKKKSKKKQLLDAETWKADKSSSLKHRLDPYSRQKQKFRFQEAYEDIDDSMDAPLDIRVGENSTIGVALGQIKTRLDADVGFPQAVYVVPEGRGKTFDPKYVGSFERLVDGKYRVHDINRRLVKDWATTKELHETNVYDWSGFGRIASKVLAQALSTDNEKVEDLRIGDWVDRGGDRKRVESVSSTVSNSYFIRFGDMDNAYIDKGDTVPTVKAS